MQHNHKIKYFLYARKSSEAEDRQVASIDAQLDELRKLAKGLNLFVIEELTEAKSAKAPGRPVFNSMLERLTNGEADGIICWKIDRLTRNPIDTGQISWMLQEEIIKHIRTYERSYLPTDNVLLMSVETGMANQFVRDLSVNVKRGFRKRVADGWITGVAPAGYLNVYDQDKRMNIVAKDPERFPLVRKMWELALDGKKVDEILDIVNNQWGYKTVKRPNEGGRAMSRSGLYKILHSPFYYGEFEYPSGSGNWVKGAHEPMITKLEFDKVGFLLGGREGRPIPQTREFAFSCIMRCGECHSTITAEEKNQVICPNKDCKFKFAYERKSECPKCGLLLSKMKNATFLHYVYYHCSKGKNKSCTQKCVEVGKLHEQIIDYLKSIQITKKYVDCAQKHLVKENAKTTITEQAIRDSQQQAYNAVEKKLDGLYEMRANREIDEQEFKQLKTKYDDEKKKLLGLLGDSAIHQGKRLKSADEFFDFCHTAVVLFEEAIEKNNLEAQRELILKLGSNLTVLDKKLNVDAPEPFTMIQKAMVAIPSAAGTIEPKVYAMDKRKNTNYDVDVLSWLGRWDSNPRPIG